MINKVTNKIMDDNQKDQLVVSLKLIAKHGREDFVRLYNISYEIAEPHLKVLIDKLKAEYEKLSVKFDACDCDDCMCHPGDENCDCPEGKDCFCEDSMKDHKDMGEKVDTLKDHTSDAAHDVKDKVSDAAHDVKDAMQDTAHDVKDTVKDTAHDVKTDVQAHAEDTKADLKDDKKEF